MLTVYSLLYAVYIQVFRRPVNAGVFAGRFFGGAVRHIREWFDAGMFK